uniref:Uncharacterized protein n=1 Tax=Hucho hucho TaxID=62062 RepID=A0A4W5KS97_9TELE
MGEDTESSKVNHSFLRDYVTEADVISTVEFNHTGDLLATGDKGGRVVVFQRETSGPRINMMETPTGWCRLVVSVPASV